MTWPADKTCATCKHWDRTKKWETGYSFDLGRCEAIPMFWDATEWSDDGNDRQINQAHKGAKAFAQDGSDYRAVVLTMTDFGCVSHENRTPPQEAAA